MPFPTISDAEQLLRQVRGIIQFIRQSTREGVSILLGIALVYGGNALSETAQPKWTTGVLPEGWWNVFALRGAPLLIGLGVCAIAYVVYRIWKQVIPPPMPQEVGPAVIKGPMAFGPHDGEIFRKLGREVELQKLLGWILDNQIPLVAVMGESGAGKTSLVRAGLHHVLKAQNIGYHYWEAVPSDPIPGLLAAIQSDWPHDQAAAMPKTKEDLCSLGNDLPGRRVVILDQFEQLRPDDESHRPIFEILENLVTAGRPPYHTTWIVVFRREYSPIWLDFEQEHLRNHRHVLLSLRMFTEQQAKNVFATLAEAAELTLDSGLVDDLLAGMRQRDQRISATDIGITFMTLSELARNKSTRELSKGDYRIAGGSTGLLADYMNHHLERYGKDDREAILRTLRALGDLDRNQRLAEGLTLEDLTQKIHVAPQQLQQYVEFLASPQVRLLEKLETGRFRLPHERLIPALRQVSGVALAEVERASLDLTKAFHAWVAGEQRSKFLLAGKELREIEKHRGTLLWREDREGKEAYLEKSLLRRRWTRLGVTAGVVLAVALGYWGSSSLEAVKYETYLAEWLLPKELYRSQYRLNALNITNGRMTHLRWLKNELEDLSIDADSLNSLDNLNTLEKLKILRLDLAHTGGISLDPLKGLTELTALTLNFSGGGVISLDPLKGLTELTALTLNFSGGGVISLDPLKGLTELTTLMLALNGSQMASLDSLKELQKLKELHLHLAPNPGEVALLNPLSQLKKLKKLQVTVFSEFSLSQVASLNPLKELQELEELALNVSHATDGSGKELSFLAPLKELKRLKTLTLHLEDSGVSSLDPLKGLTELTALTLSFSGGGVISLDPLKGLTELTTLTLALNGSQMASLDSLKELQRLKELTLDLYLPEDGNGKKMPSLAILKHLKGLTTIKLKLDGRHMVNLDLLKDLKELEGLKELNVEFFGLYFNLPEGVNLDPLKDLKELTSLTLELPQIGGKLPSLAPLAKLKKLGKLTLSAPSQRASGQQVSLAPLEGLQDLNYLELNLSMCEVPSLNFLKGLKRLTSLTLDLEGTKKLPDLDPLSGLSELTMLTLKLAWTEMPDIKPLKELKKLKTVTLDLQNTKVDGLAPLKELKELKTVALKLGGTKVDSIELMNELPELEKLKITHNERYGLNLNPTKRIRLDLELFR